MSKANKTNPTKATPPPVSNKLSLMLANIDCFYPEDCEANFAGVGEALQRIAEMIETLGQHFIDADKDSDTVKCWGAVMTLRYFIDRVPRIFGTFDLKKLEEIIQANLEDRT